MASFKRLLANIYVYMVVLWNRVFYRGKKNGRVLIIIDGLIGDTVLIQDFIKACGTMLQQKAGYSVDLFFSKPFVKEFFLECCDPYGMNILDISFQRKNTELGDMIRVLRAFRHCEYEYILNPLPKHKGDKLVGCLKGLNKFAVRDDLHIPGMPLNNMFRRLAYTRTIEVDKTEMEFVRYKRLLEMAGVTGYETEQPALKDVDCPIPVSGVYGVIAVGASEAGKRFANDRYVQILDHITERYNMPMVLVGGGADTADIEYIMSKVKRSDLCLDVSGKTSFPEWVKIIRNALFLVGNDSASAHIAAATGTPSVCIVGKWHYRRFYPYRLDVSNGFEPSPVFCADSLPCENCGKVVDIMPNPYCKMAHKKSESYECIERIKLEQVTHAVDLCLARASSIA